MGNTIGLYKADTPNPPPSSSAPQQTTSSSASSADDITPPNSPTSDVISAPTTNSSSRGDGFITDKTLLMWHWLVLNKQQILSGLTVSLAQVPEAIAFSFVAGVDPHVGLTAAWIMGIVTSIAGGRPGMVSGATGATAVVMVDLVKTNGVDYLFYAVMLAGLFEILFGLLRLGKLLRFIPHPVMVGFCNGLAIIIGLAQFSNFKTQIDLGENRRTMEVGGSFNVFTDDVPWITGATAGFVALEVSLTFLIAVLLPLWTTAVPSSMVGIIVSTAIEWGIVRQVGSETNTVGEIASVKGSFPVPIWVDDNYNIPTLNTDTFTIVLPTAIIVAVVSLVESLMTLELIDEMTETVGSPNREALGQGLAQFLSGMLGSMGGCAMIGQSMINVKSGGTTRLSTFVAGLFLLIIVLVAYPVINIIPVAALAGVMFCVVYHTFEWSSIRLMLSACLPRHMREKNRTQKFLKNSKVKRSDILVVLVVMTVTLLLDLAIAVAAGVVLAALVYGWDSGETVSVKRNVDASGPGTTVVRYFVSGPIFFASVKIFLGQFDPENDEGIVEVHLDNSDIMDWSAIEALNVLNDRYEKKEFVKEIKFLSIKETSKALMQKANEVVTANVIYEVTDYNDVEEGGRHLNVVFERKGIETL